MRRLNMEPENLPQTTIYQELEVLLTGAMRFVESLMMPGWRLYQVLIILALIFIFYGMHHLSGRWLQAWVRSRDGWKTWQLRMIVPIRQRLGLVWFSALGWVNWGALQSATWPSSSYLIGLAATLATAWLLIAFVSRFIRNRPLRIIVRWSLWIFATLYYLNVHEAVGAFLDDLAFEFGNFRISIMTIISALVVIGVLLTLARIGSTTTATTIRRNEDISPSMQVLAVKAVQITSYGFAFFVGINTVGIDLSGLAILTGAIGVGLGFGLQKVISNLVSGVIILLDKSIKPGDVISLGETFGWIQTLGARYASVVTRDGKEYLIPNEDLITNEVVNWSHSNDYVRLDIFFGTAYAMTRTRSAN
jgi:small-conductance mechanosensitive channel